MESNKLSFLLNGIHVQGTKKMGRGVFTSRAIAAGKLIELAPVIVMTAEERLLLDKTLLHDYIFVWGKEEDQCAMALGLIAVYNHSYNANCEYGMYFNKHSISIISTRAIKAGEELFIYYNGTWNDEKKVWFETK